jgi:hypothetical protein
MFLSFRRETVCETSCEASVAWSADVCCAAHVHVCIVSLRDYIIAYVKHLRNNPHLENI